MKTVLERAREEASKSIEGALADFDAIERRSAEKQSYYDERRADLLARIEEAQAALDAIDAAIAAEAGKKPDPIRIPFADWDESALREAIDGIEKAIAKAEAPATTPISICLGDTTIEASVSVEDAKRIMGRQQRKKREPIRIPIEVDTSALEEALAKAALNRVDLEFDTDRHSIKISGYGLDVAQIASFLIKKGEELAAGGIATGRAPFWVVVERAGESIMSTAEAEELLKSVNHGEPTATVTLDCPVAPETSDHPIQLGDTVEARTKFRVVGISERSTDGLRLGASEENGPFCQLEVDACGTIKTLELLASDLRRL